MAYIPGAGDIVWLQLTPQAGHKPARHRSALVLSPASYNRIGLMLCCPITTRIKGYPFDVALSSDPASMGLSDHVKSLDWRVRKALRKGQAKALELAAVRVRAAALIG